MVQEQRRRSSLTNRIVKGAVGQTQTKTNASAGEAVFGALSGLDNKGAAGQLKMAAGARADGAVLGSTGAGAERGVAVATTAGSRGGAAVFDDSRGLNSEIVPVSDRKPDRLKFYDRSNSKVGDLDEETEDRFTRFNRWMEENGALTPDLYMHKYTENVRGVHALNEIEPHRQLVLIPKKCLIMETMGRETPIGAKVHRAWSNNEIQLTVPNHCQVIIYMLTTMQEGKGHFFSPYYDILPADFNNFPIFWTEEELSWLEGSYLITQIRERKGNIRSDYDNICKVSMHLPVTPDPLPTLPSLL